MKLERAQDIYSDYEEGTLSPAMKLALEQHFDSEAGAKEDFDDFSKIFGLLSLATQDEVEVPHGFRATIMQRVSEESGGRQVQGGFLSTLRGLFTQPGRREAAGVLAVALIFAAAVAFKHPAVTPATSLPLPGVPAPPQPADVETVIQAMDLDTGSNMVYHDLRVHLPASIPSASINAYVISETDQFLDPAVRDRDATPVLRNQQLTNDESMVVPIGLVRPAPKGATLNLLVEWTAPGSSVPGAQAVFTPLNPNDMKTPSTAPPSNGNFFDSLQTISSAYHTTIIADAASAPTTPVEAWSPGDDVDTALRTVADSAGYVVKMLDGNTYLLTHKPIIVKS